MEGKVVLVTGATSGIGRETALALAQRGATTVVVGRDAARVRHTVARMCAAVGQRVEGLTADLSERAQVQRLADQFLSGHDRLDVLVNNAGAVFATRRESADGLEMTFALNHMGYFSLTGRLLEALRAGAPARVVNVSSNAHHLSGLDFSDLQARRRYSGWLAYGRSKLANVLFSYELARRLDGLAVTVNAVHPGFVASGFGLNNRKLVWRLTMRLARPFGRSPAHGARTVVFLASSATVDGVTGGYWADQRAVRSSKASYDEHAAARLWAISAELDGGRL